MMRFGREDPLRLLRRHLPRRRGGGEKMFGYCFGVEVAGIVGGEEIGRPSPRPSPWGRGRKRFWIEIDWVLCRVRW